MSSHSSPKHGVDFSKKKLNKNDVPFYEPPSGMATSSQIIKEAREKLYDAKRNAPAYVPESSNLVRTLSSNRPFTPREEKRTLFGPKSTRPVNERPPSSFCIGSKSFDTDAASRPLSVTRLSPISNSRPSLSTQQSFEEDTKPNRSEESNILRLTSPKTISSRLAPLEITGEKKPTLKKEKIDDSQTKFNSTNAEVDKNQSNLQEDEKIQKNWKNYIEPLLNQMEDYFKKNQIDSFCDSTDMLNKLLYTHQIYSKTCSKRGILLKIIFKYLDTDSDRIKLKISRIILNMKVTGNNLTNICRLLFSISRNTDNDSYFMDNNILDSLLSSAERFEFKENSDTVVYFCGTIKNLSENSKILKQLSAKNLEETLAKLIKDLSKYYKDNETLKSEAGHALVQLTSALRNLADLSNTRHKFLNLRLIEHLVYILKYFTSDSELMLNVSRILSKLTLHTDCCQELASHESCYKSFLKIMIKHDSKQDLIVRIGFILGNVTARHENARVRFMNEKYSVDTVTNTLKTYFNHDLQSARKDLNNLNKLKNLEDINENEPNPNEDVLIKFIRVIANLAINEEAGDRLASRQDLLDVLLKILDVKDLTCEELVIDTIVTINNLSFYNSELFFNNSQKLVDCLMKYLLSNNSDAIVEVFRVFANLSRDQSTRGYLVQRKVNVLAIAYLYSNNRELIYIVIGVLINMMTDPENRFVLKEEKGVKKLIEILNEVGPTDWQLSSMICKLLMNYSENTKTNLNYSYFESNELKILRVVLTELLNEKFAIRETPKTEFKKSSNDDDNGENIDEYMNFLWKQDFCPVANLLLKRIIEAF